MLVRILPSHIGLTDFEPLEICHYILDPGAQSATKVGNVSSNDSAVEWRSAETDEAKPINATPRSRGSARAGIRSTAGAAATVCVKRRRKTPIINSSVASASVRQGCINANDDDNNLIVRSALALSVNERSAAAPPRPSSFIL